MKRLYSQYMSRPLNLAVHASLIFFTGIFTVVAIALKGDILTLSTAALHGLYFFLTIDHRRVEQGKARPIFSEHYYRLVRGACLLVIGGVALFLRYALGSPWGLFDLSLWIRILTTP